MKKTGTKKTKRKELKMIITSHQPFDVHGNFISDFKCVYDHKDKDCDCKHPRWYREYLLRDEMCDHFECCICHIVHCTEEKCRDCCRCLECRLSLDLCKCKQSVGS